MHDNDYKQQNYVDGVWFIMKVVIQISSLVMAQFYQLFNDSAFITLYLKVIHDMLTLQSVCVHNNMGL